MKFINVVKYKDLERIARARSAHFAYADRLRAEGKLAIGGPLVDDQSRRIGLLFIYEAGSRDEAVRFAEEDPFTVADALNDWEISELRLRAANSDLLIEANRAARQSGGEHATSQIFANYAKYTADKARLAAVRSAHWEYDRTLESAGKLALAGTVGNDEGGLFVYNAIGRDGATSYVEHDPFTVQGVFEHCEVFAWLIEGVNPDLLNIVKGEPSLTG